jgi:hypothetical protein
MPEATQDIGVELLFQPRLLPENFVVADGDTSLGCCWFLF